MLKERIELSIVSYQDTGIPFTYKSKNCWSGQQESNPHSHFRRVLYYPLYDGQKFGAPGWNRTSTRALQERTSTTKDTRANYLVVPTRIELVSMPCQGIVLAIEPRN